MPELPEVEVVRRGLERHLTGRAIVAACVLHPRAARRQLAPPLPTALEGARFARWRRRGKFLWAELEAGSDPSAAFALVVHLGMSGQMLIDPPESARAPDPTDKHLRIAVDLDDGSRLRFVDQRTFGGWFTCPLVDDPFGGDGPIAAEVAHIAPDPFEACFDPEWVIARARRSEREIKKVLLDQEVIAGVGNIYADEALWRAQVSGLRIAARTSVATWRGLLESASAVMAEALAVGGTSFDALYVDTAGDPGYFARELNAYGREGLPCARCGAAIRRAAFMGRSSFSCPRCQRR